MRERQDENRTREAGNRDEVEGVVAITLNLFRNGAVGFIDWLDEFMNASLETSEETAHQQSLGDENASGKQDRSDASIAPMVGGTLTELCTPRKAASDLAP